MKRLAILFLTMAMLAAAVFHLLRDTDTATPAIVTPVRIPEQSGSGAGEPAKLPADGLATPATSNRTRHSDSETPTWLLPASRAATSSSTATASPVMADPKIIRLNALLEKLNHLQMQPDVDAKAAAAAIAELEQINGSSVMSGIRLDVLRENLLMSDQIEIASKELLSLQHADTADAPERAALLKSKTANLAALRSRIRHDIMQSPAALVSP